MPFQTCKRQLSHAAENLLRIFTTLSLTKTTISVANLENYFEVAAVFLKVIYKISGFLPKIIANEIEVATKTSWH